MALLGDEAVLSLLPTLVEPRESKAAAPKMVISEARRAFERSSFLSDEIDGRNSLENDLETLLALTANKSSLLWRLRERQILSNLGRYNEHQVVRARLAYKAPTQPQNQLNTIIRS
jgi:hypothetical protein